MNSFKVTANRMWIKVAGYRRRRQRDGELAENRGDRPANTSGAGMIRHRLYTLCFNDVKDMLGNICREWETKVNLGRF